MFIRIGQGLWYHLSGLLGPRKQAIKTSCTDLLVSGGPAGFSWFQVVGALGASSVELFNFHGGAESVCPKSTLGVWGSGLTV